jgi:non-ribosomal peptide synthetase component F
MVVFHHALCVLICIPNAVAFVIKPIPASTYFSRTCQLNRCSERSSIRKHDRVTSQLQMAIPAEDVQIRVADMKWVVVPDIWESLASIIPDKSMLVDPVHGDAVDLTFGQCNNLITIGAAGLQKMGLMPDECVSIFAENSYKWFVADQAIMKAGGCNSVRGALAPIEELRYIYQNSKSVAIIVESPSLLQKFFATDDSDTGSSTRISDSGAPRFVVVLFSRGMNGTELAMEAGTPDHVKVMSYEEWMASATKKEFKSVPRDSA